MVGGYGDVELQVMCGEIGVWMMNREYFLGDEVLYREREGIF